MDNITKQLCINSTEKCEINDSFINWYSFSFLILSGLVVSRGLYTLYLIEKEYIMNEY